MAVAKAQVDLIARDKVSGVAANVERVLLRMQAKMQAVAQAAQRMLMIGAAAVGGMVYAAVKQSEAEQRLESVLKATGHAAGFTSAQLKQMASDLQLVTAYGDETTLAAMAMLLTFKEIKGDMFKDAIEMAMNMSVVMGTDLKSSVIMFGKALNEPAKRMTALKLAGVSFTDAQVEQIKTLEASGDMLGAQTVLMGALRDQFGTAARDEIKQAGGALKQMKNEVGDLAEDMGQLLMPTVMAFLADVKNVVMSLAVWAKSNSDIILKIGKWAAGIGILLVILPRLIGTLAGMVAILRGVAAGIMLVMNLSGPAGWAVVAGAIAATVIAVGVMKTEYTNLMSSIREAREEGERLGEAEKKRAEERLATSVKAPTLGQIKGDIIDFRKNLRWAQKQLEELTNPLEKVYGETTKIDIVLADWNYWIVKERESVKELTKEVQRLAVVEETARAEAEAEAEAKAKKREEDHEAWLRSLEDEFEVVGKTADEVERMRRAWKGASEQELHEGQIIQEATALKKKELEDEERKQKDLNKEARAILAMKDDKEQVVAARFEGLTQAWKRIQASAISGRESTVQERQLKAVEDAAARLKEGDVNAHKKLDEVKDTIEDAMGGPAVFGA